MIPSIISCVRIIAPPSTVCDLTADLPTDFNLCESDFTSISSYYFKGENYVVQRSNPSSTNDLDLSVINCSTNETACVSGPALGVDPRCAAFFAEALLVETIWTDADCPDDTSGDCPENNQYYTAVVSSEGLNVEEVAGTVIDFQFTPISTVRDFCLDRGETPRNNHFLAI